MTYSASTESTSLQQQNAYENLYDDMQVEIMSHSDYPTRFSLALTSRKIYKVFCDNFDFNPFTFADYCAKFGYTGLLAYSVKNGGPFDRQTSLIAARYKNLEILKAFNLTLLAPEEKGSIIEKWILAAEELDEMPIFDWIQSTAREHNIECSLITSITDTPKYAARWGHFDRHVKSFEDLEKQCNETNDTIFERYKKKFLNKAFLEALSNDHLHIVKWCVQNGADCLENNTSQILSILRNSNIETVEYLYDIASTLVKNLILNFVGEHTTCIDIELHKFIASKGVKNTFSINVFLSSERYYDQRFLEYLKYFDSLGNIQNELTVTEMRNIPYCWATKEILMWLKEKGYPVIFEGALRVHISCRPNLEIIRWILEESKNQKIDIWSYYSESIWREAAKLCDIKILNALWQAKPNEVQPSKYIISSLIIKLSERMERNKRVVFKHYRRTIQWLLEKGFEWGDCSPRLKSIKPIFIGKNKEFFDELVQMGFPVS